MEASDEAAAAANGDDQVPEAPAERAQMLIERVVAAMGLDTEVEVEEND